MRIFIIALSIVFFLLAGIVTFKAAMLPGSYTGYMNEESHTQPHEQAGSAYARNAGSPEKARRMAAALKSRLNEPASAGPAQKEIAARPAVSAPAPSRSPSSAEPRILAILGGKGIFHSGQIILSETVMNTINRLVREINAYPGSRITVEGHTDNVPIRASKGSRYYDNMELSFLRAKAVADLLVRNGIARERISVTGYGDARPIDTNDTPGGRAKNRRVEVRLIPGEGES